MLNDKLIACRARLALKRLAGDYAKNRAFLQQHCHLDTKPLSKLEAADEPAMRRWRRCARCGDPQRNLHGANMPTLTLQQLKSRVHQAAGIWRDDRYPGAAGPVCREFFFKRLAQRYHLGLDEYLPEHEDAVDLYLCHIRASFDSFDAAVDYLANKLRIAPESLLSPQGGLPLR